MNKPGFLEGVVLALLLSLAGSAVYHGLTVVLSDRAALQLLIAGLGLAYVAYLLGRSTERVGRPTMLALWFAAAGAVWLWSPPLPVQILAHLGLVWLVRSLYFHASLVAALVDLLLNGLALAAGVGAALHAGSLFLGLWCFFLVQALFVALPNPDRAPAGNGPRVGADGDDRFLHARQAADAALRRLSSIH